MKRESAAQPWYRVLAQSDPAVAEMLIFDEIGGGFWSDGVTAKQFVADLAALPESVKTIHVRVNSPGGSVFDALAIANALRNERQSNQRRVEMTIEGLAASAATIVTSAGDAIRIADNALMMVHNPIGLVIGPAGEMRKAADMLDRSRDSIVATYRWVSPLSVEELSALMDATTWMNADEALANGFATEVVTGQAAAASVAWRPEAIDRLGEIPEVYRVRVAAWVPEPPPAPAAADPREVVKACKAAGLAELADDLLGQPMAVVTAKLEAVTAERAAARARAAEIVALCKAARMPELAESLISGGATVESVKAGLVVVTAKLDKIEIDGHLAPERPAAKKAAIDTAATYQRWNHNGRGA